MCKLSGNGSATKQEVPEFHELLQELYERSAEGLDSFQKEKLHELLGDFEDIFSNFRRVLRTWVGPLLHPMESTQVTVGRYYNHHVDCQSPRWRRQGRQSKQW